MKKQFLVPILAVLLCISGFLWLNASRPALLDNDIQSKDPGSESEIREIDIPLTEVPPTDVKDSGAGQDTEDPWTQFSQTQLDTMQEVLRLVNQARAEQNLPELELDPTLCGAAQIRAKECVTNFSHTRPDGTKYKTAIAEAGITSLYTGENAATGHTTAKQVVDSWLRSKGHRANILNERFTKLGVGFEKNTGNRYRGYAWVELFIEG